VKNWIIVSWEHKAFWKPGGVGYSKRLDEAGLYTKEEAEEICARANIVREPDDPNEVAVPVDYAGLL
jgi:hypothetical protein